MSTSGDNVELKAGHAPAEKIGGVRVARKEKHHSEAQETDEVNNPASNEGQETSDALDEIRESNNVLASSGLAGQTKLDYPEAAVRAYHEKPIPTHSQPPTQVFPGKNIGNRHNHALFQPRKN